MPLAGTICCQTGQPASFESCEALSRQGVCEHPLPVLVNMRKNAKRREGVGISASVLSACPRQVILQERNDFYEDPADYYARWFGTFGHYAVEMDGPYPDVVQEVRFYRTLDVDGVDVEVSGQPDWIDKPHRVVADHKMGSYKPREPRIDHVAQLNVYRWLIEGGYTRGTYEEFVDYSRDGTGEDWQTITYQSSPGQKRNPLPAGFEVRELILHYYHAGGKADKRRHTAFKVPIWLDENVESYIRQKLRPHMQYRATQSLSGIGVSGKDQEWRGNFCPFRHSCNPGVCCQATPGKNTSADTIDQMVLGG